MKNAIEKAIEGGWMLDTPNVQMANEGRAWLFTETDGIKEKILHSGDILISPLFWQALGKAMGWDEEYDYENKREAWIGYWHRFIDHLASGGDAESFFATLIPNQK